MIKKSGCICAWTAFLACALWCTHFVVKKSVEIDNGLHAVELDQVTATIKANGGIEAFVGFCRKVARKLPPDEPLELGQVMATIKANGGIEAFVGSCREVTRELPSDEPFVHDKLREQCYVPGVDSFFGLKPQFIEFEKGPQCLSIQLLGGFAHKGIIVAIGDGAFKSGEIPNVGVASEQWNWKRIHQDVFWYSEIE